MNDSEALFVLYREYMNGGKVLLMNGLNKSKEDFHDLLVIATCFARLGHTARVLGPVHYKDPVYKMVYAPLIGTRYYRKCPDLMIDNSYYEYESYVKPWKKEKVQRMLTHGLRQSSRVIINNNKGAVDRFVRKLIMARVNLNAPIEEVWLYEKGSIRRVYITTGRTNPPCEATHRGAC